MKQPRVSLRRMHFTKTGEVKRAISYKRAEELRAKGMHTYLCPVCGKTHASSRP